jgi:hypothetical protein
VPKKKVDHELSARVKHTAPLGLTSKSVPGTEVDTPYSFSFTLDSRMDTSEEVLGEYGNVKEARSSPNILYAYIAGLTLNRKHRDLCPHTVNHFAREATPCP